MSNPSKIKGDKYEWDTITWAEQFLTDVASLLTVQRTRAGYERDYGDLHVRTPDDRTLAALQLKNRREFKISAWCNDAQWQGERARARFAALFVKRTRVADPGQAFAIMPANVYLRLLAQLYEAERDRDAARAELTVIGAMVDESGTVHGAVLGPDETTLYNLREPGAFGGPPL